MSLNLQEIRALGECLNVTWGRSTDGLKLTHHFNGDMLDLQMQSIIYFAGEQSLRPQVTNQRAIANDIFADGLKKIKADFKDRTGKALTVKEISRDDDVSLIQSTSVSPRKVAYFRCMLRLQIA